MRFRGVLAYNGARYMGFQKQRPGTLTIQGVVEQAIAHITQEPITIIGSGRTDTGVHARGQVIAFDSAWRHGVGDLQRGINAHLPLDVVLMALETTTDDFHPRYDATRRRYIYQCYTAPHHDPLRDPIRWYVGQRIDLEAIAVAIPPLIGTHDFAAFGWPTQGDVTFRTLTRAEIRREAEQGEFCFTFEANAFLKRMIRNLVGTLIQVGRRRLPPEAVKDILNSAERNRAVTAPPHGLILDHVSYEKELET